MIRKMDRENGVSWSYVAGRRSPWFQDSRGGRGGARPKPRQLSKCQRTSTAVAAADTSKSSFFSLDEFHSLSISDKLDKILWQPMRGASSRKKLCMQYAMRSISTNNVLTYLPTSPLIMNRVKDETIWYSREFLKVWMKAVLSEFLSDKLGLDQENIFVQRIHRTGKLKRRQWPGEHVMVRPLIAAFWNW